MEWVLEILKEILKEEKRKAKVAVIFSDVDKAWLKEKLKKGMVKPLGPVAELSENEIERAISIVAVMGVEPYIRAFEEGAQIVLAGRSNDPAIFASFGIMMGAGEGPAFHLGKILECGAIAAVPGTASDGMLGFLYRDKFIVEPANPKRICTKTSVAAHSLYEKEHPYLIKGPEGTLNMKNARFTQIDERRVKVEGSSFEKAKECWIKLEGARASGYRSITIAFIKDPLMVQAQDEWKEATKEAAKEYFGEGTNLILRTVGKEEITLIIEAIAETQEHAQAVCSWARSFLMHYHYTGRKATSGNLAIPFSPSDIPMGRVYEFNIHHLVKLEEGESIFEINTELL